MKAFLVKSAIFALVISACAPPSQETPVDLSKFQQQLKQDTLQTPPSRDVTLHVPMINETTPTKVVIEINFSPNGSYTYTIKATGNEAVD